MAAPGVQLRNILPDAFANHSMREIYKYEDFDEGLGMVNPMPAGHFVVTRPHATFFSPSWFNHEADPFPRLEEVIMDKGDVLHISAIKTGSHWVYEIIRMIRAGSAAYGSGSRFDQWIDIQSYDKIAEVVPAGSRIISTHLSPSCLPPNFRRSDTKVVIGLRNMKDTFVSLFHHFMMKQQTLGMPLNLRQQWDSYFKYLLYSRRVVFNSVFDFNADVWDNYRQDPNVLIVQFELLKRNTSQTVNDIAKHIGVVLSSELLDDIVKAVQFENLARGKYESEEFLRKEISPNFSIYRKGDIGDWKNWFTVAQNEEFHRVYDEWNKDRQVPAVWE